jgi:hypothetical protein
MRKRLSEFLSDFNIAERIGSGDPEVTGLAHDSAEYRPATSFSPFRLSRRRLPPRTRRDFPRRAVIVHQSPLSDLFRRRLPQGR